MPPSDPAAVPPPEWAIRWALFRKWGPLKAPLVRSEDADPDSLTLAATAAQFRDGALREAAVVALAEMRMDIRNAILSLLHTPPSGGA